MKRQNNRVAILAGVLGIVALAAPGCVAKKEFRTNVADTDKRITAVEGEVEESQKRVQDLSRETDSKISTVGSKADQAQQTGSRALTTAQAAETAAKGKLIWETTLTDDNVKFEHDQADLSTGAMSSLDTLVSKAKAYGKAIYIEIEGHTDSSGDPEYNLVLGEKRAAVVRDYLNEKGGIPLHAINIVSRGEGRPIADNASQDGRKQNRRVVVRVLE